MKIREFLLRYAYAYCWMLCACLICAAVLRHSVQQVSSSQQIGATTRIVIDPGHGGVDGGTTSVTGVLEKELNLQIALRLDHLLRLMGQTTVMSRTTDTSLSTVEGTIREQKRSDLRNRVELANQRPNTILVSIHQNSYPDAQYTGPQIFSTADHAAQALAQQLQQTMNHTLGTSRSPKLSSGVYLMNHITCPGLLVECGFLSNAQEEAQLRDPSHQKTLCCLMAAVLAQYCASETPA